MGSYGARIGQYWMDFHESEITRMRGSSKKREYFTKKKITVEFIVFQGEGDTYSRQSTEELNIPFTKVFKIKKDKKTGMYQKDWDTYDLRKTLWMEILRRGINVYLTPYINNSSFLGAAEYYLESPLLDNRVQLSNEKPQPILIEGYEIFKWFDKHGLSYK